MNIASWMVLFEVIHEKPMIFVLIYNILSYQQTSYEWISYLTVKGGAALTLNVSTKRNGLRL